LNPRLDDEIRSFCAQSQVDITESIPFDESVTEGIQQGVPLVEFGHRPASRAVTELWGEVQRRLVEEVRM
jgi:MinD superfamily P-loop ATPase